MLASQAFENRQHLTFREMLIAADSNVLHLQRVRLRNRVRTVVNPGDDRHDRSDQPGDARDSLEENLPLAGRLDLRSAKTPIGGRHYGHARTSAENAIADRRQSIRRPSVITRSPGRDACATAAGTSSSRGTTCTGPDTDFLTSFGERVDGRRPEWGPRRQDRCR